MKKMKTMSSALAPILPNMLPDIMEDGQMSGQQTIGVMFSVYNTMLVTVNLDNNCIN